MMDFKADAPLKSISNPAILKAHFVKISPQRHFAYGTTWLVLSLVIIAIIVYQKKIRAKNKLQSS
jgi:cytochrome oxidase assembly protein ShyY1